MKIRYVLLFAGILTIVISCSKDSTDVYSTETGGESINSSISISGSYSKGTTEGLQLTGEDEEDLLANSTFSNTVKITYSNNVTIDNPLSDKGVTVTVTNQDVVINATVAAVAYDISGSTADGSLKIYSDKKFKLNLNAVSIKNNDGPAINIQSSKRAFIVLNNTNTLEDGSSYNTSTEDQKGTFFSEGQLIFSGDGSLAVTGNYKHGIASDDYIRFISGNITVTKAGSDAIHANDAIYVDAGTFNLSASSDGIEAEKGPIIINNGTFSINVADDGIAASWDEDNTIDPYLIINGGTFDITCLEGEGIESKSSITINNGTINISAYDDAINAGDAIYINGGKIVAHSKSNDGIDSNGILTITGGQVIAIGANSPETGFDCDNNTFKITGGWIVGLGGSTSTPTASVCTQASTIYGSGKANTIYSILNSENVELITFKSPVNFTTALYSQKGILVGSKYTLATVGSVSSAEEFNSIYTKGLLANVTVASTFTQSSLVSKLGGSSGGGGGQRP